MTLITTSFVLAPVSLTPTNWTNQVPLGNALTSIDR